MCMSMLSQFRFWFVFWVLRVVPHSLFAMVPLRFPRPVVSECFLNRRAKLCKRLVRAERDKNRKKVD